MMSKTGGGNATGVAVSLNLVDAAGNTPAPIGSHFVQIAIVNPASGQASSGWALASAALTVQVDSGSCGLIIPEAWLCQPNSASPNSASSNSTSTNGTSANLLPGVVCTNQPGSVTYYPSSPASQTGQLAICRHRLSVLE